jgi:cellulose synthase/poly-beta-1,6-N-acetylglucosamine synthase-like glycosyltransferase
MIIQILSDLKEEGSLARERHPTVAPFFAGSNVAMRRNAILEIGCYDPNCITGEDCDVCARLSAADWELYMRRNAVVFHKNPSTLRRLIGQWFGYGLYHPYVFAKHNERAIEVYMRVSRPFDGERYICIFYKRSPLAVVVFLTRFLVLHMALLVTGVVWLLGLTAAGWACLCLTTILATSYAWPDVKQSGILLGSAFAAIRYVADMALFIGAFIGGLRQKMFYFSATVD